MTSAGDPDAMRAEAARLRLRAEQVAGLVRKARDEAGSMTFEGPFARLVGADLERDTRFGNEAAAALGEAAATLERSASEVEAAIIAERRRLAQIAESERLEALRRRTAR